MYTTVIYASSSCAVVLFRLLTDITCSSFSARWRTFFADSSKALISFFLMLSHSLWKFSGFNEWGDTWFKITPPTPVVVCTNSTQKDTNPTILILLIKLATARCPPHPQSKTEHQMKSEYDIVNWHPFIKKMDSSNKTAPSDCIYFRYFKKRTST